MAVHAIEWTCKGVAVKKKDLSQVYYIDSMLREAEYCISAEKLAGEKLLKLSCGSAYAVSRLQKALRRLHREGKISFWIKGTDFHREDGGTKYLLDRFPTEEADESLDALDPLLTVVCLSL